MSDLAAGDVLEGRYAVDRPIARGGMSTVYRCLDTRLDREVAAKVMHPRYVDDPLFLDRFQREARAMAQMSHPNLVNVYDFSSHGEDVFLIMELITGGTLRELLAERGPMPPHAAAEVMRSMLTGLSVAHRRGLVHRDIKPDNILINGDNSVKLADFGLVRAASESQRSTDQIVGTVAYLSPEQVDGSELTQASDVYSAGIVLFELLTGTQPFSGDTSLAHAMARLHRDVPPPSSRIAGVPMLFDELVATATARHPRDRFADADEFLDALEDVSADLDLPDFTVPAPTQSAAHRVAAIPTGVTQIEQDGAEEPELAPETRFDHQPVYEPEREHLQEPVREPSPALYHQDHQQPYRPQAPAPVPAHAPAHPPVPAQAPVREPEAPRIPEPETNRSAAATAVMVLLMITATAAVAVGGWWYGSGWYGEIPEIIRMPEYY
ncbi:protein kinase [Corynebacterium genitalium ATCC 33030]|uniref:non-specific serine/threonine protein kinase n=1 Tax=Corynebacterium genitalium ATCC 33030 TaxID=585529 RepID=D7WEK7_9CORY|nr:MULTISPECIES: protein kinase [Corynebacterium]EFK53584.1 kinase domain protein [Corynebacterium genitalium ATCC 33030]MCQ4620759.1 serine/threonine protein kinase [Corynebacterium sp. CCUG 71335]MCQ4622723.1 serine/threonine protein kinase [Corynebacterium sp. CCUG 70398]UUA88834.1 protein kinase [Corynebacterium genitalium ATCC 33030]